MCKRILILNIRRINIVYNTHVKMYQDQTNNESKLDLLTLDTEKKGVPKSLPLFLGAKRPLHIAIFRPFMGISVCPI